jgi:hypothetical protein
MQLILIGAILLAFGVLYRRKPTLYRRGLWLKTSIAIRLLSEEGYKRYIRGLGLLFIALGAGFILAGVAAMFGFAGG